MNRLRNLHLTWLTLSVHATLFAQAAPSSTAEGETLSLSPFVVDATADKGYQASATLAGSRLKTELKDLAASVTVLTNDFMDDLGATDIAGALAFVAGAENDRTTDPTTTNTLNLGYLGGDFGDVNTRSGEVRVRGLGRASSAANFVQVIAAPDRYNVDRADFLRGANSIIFGLAEPAGMINYTTKVANLRKNSNRVETKVDSLGSTRSVLDVSRTLIKDRLAVRGVVLYGDQRYEVDTAFFRDKRLFLTATYKPFKDTTVTAFVEHTDNLGRRPNFRTSQDNVSGWLSLYNEYARKLTPQQLADAFYWDPTVRTSTGVPTNSVITVDGKTLDLGLLRRQMDGNANGTALFYTNQDWNNPQGGATLFATRAVNGTAVNGAFRQAFIRSSSPLEGRSGFTDPQVTNSGIVPFQEVEIGALPGNFRRERGRKVNVTVDQRIMQDLHLSATFQKELFRQEQQFTPIAQQQQVSIDLNVKLPDGRTNPNFLRPFIYGRSIGDDTNEELENTMVQLNYDFDFAKSAPRFGWLGFHRLTGLYTRSKADRLTYRYNNQVANQIPGVLSTTSVANHGARWMFQVWYIGDPVQVGDTSLRLTGFPSQTDASFNRSFDYTYYDNVSRTWKKSPEQIRLSRLVIPGGRSYTVQENEGTGVSLQSYFWNKRIVTLFGYRRDSVDSFRGALVSTAEPLSGTNRGEYLPFNSPTFSISSPTTTQSVVVHATDWLRVFASRSENFASTSPRTDSLFRPIDPQNGETLEAGLGLQLFNNRLSLRLSAFDSSQNKATNNGATSTASFRVEVVEDLIYNALQSTGRLSEWWTVGPNGRSTAQYDRPLNIAATEDSVSKGLELEVVYNPTDNWRMAFNVGKLKNTSTNVAGELRDFLAARHDFYKKYWTEGLRADGTNNSNPSSAELIRDRLINTVLVNYVGDSVREGTSNPGVSEYALRYLTSYSFRSGALKGLGVGGYASWEAGKIVGFGQKDATFNLGGVENHPGKVSDPDQAYRRNTPVSGGLFVNYSRPLFNDRVRWKVQVNAQNLFGEHGLRVIAVNPDRTPIWGVSQPRVLEISNSFDF